MKTLIIIAAIAILSIGIVIFLKRFKSIITVLLNLFDETHE